MRCIVTRQAAGARHGNDAIGRSDTAALESRSQRDEDGGRIVGEVCHFADMLTFLAGTGEPPTPLDGRAAASEAVNAPEEGLRIGPAVRVGAEA